MLRRRSPMPKPELSEARVQGLLNIGEAADASGVSAKSIRHYEEKGLIPPAHRTFANYRLYSHSDVHTLRFIKSARSLGFTLPAISKLLSLWQNQSRSSAEVKQLAQLHVDDLERRILEMQDMRDTLKHLASLCHGDRRPDCPILKGMAGQK